jgi:hypothetical protein
LGYSDTPGGCVLCDVHCEAELADDADFALAAGVVGSAETVDLHAPAWFAPIHA